MSPARLRCLVGQMRRNVNRIGNRPVPAHLAGNYYQAVGILEDLEAHLADEGLGLAWFLALPLIGAVGWAAYEIGVAADAIMGTATEGVQQVVTHASNAASIATYALVGFFVYDFARRRIAG